jgi:hypothetical protein
VIGEDEDLSRYALVLCPATQKLRTTTWMALAARARAGATIYWSYLSGDHSFHQGGWCPNFEELTGLSHRLRYGCFDLPGERVTLRADGLDLSLPTGERHSPPYPLARLPIELTSPDVRALAYDGDGRAAVTVHRLGAGQVVFCAYPIERYLAERPDGSIRDGHRLYQLVGDLAGEGPRYPTHHPHVQSRVIEDGPDDLVVVQHRGWTEAVDDATAVPAGSALLFERGAKGGALGEKGVRVYRVTGVRSP